MELARADLGLQQVPRKLLPYFERAIGESSRICSDKLRSILVFGSVARGEFSDNVSDVDLIFVVADDTPHNTKERLDLSLKRLEASAGLQAARTQFLWVFASRTALFKSHFILRRQTLLSLKAKQIFDEADGFGLPLGRLFYRLVPRELVLRNILASARILWGENVLNSIPSVPRSYDPARVFVVSIILSVFGVVSSFLFEEGTLFSLEAVKWFLLDTNSTSNSASPNLKEATVLARKRGLSPVLERFVLLREHYRHSVLFSLACPMYLCYSFLKMGGTTKLV